ADGDNWLLLNASPDIRQQILATRELQPRRGGRHTPIRAVFVTNGDVDHIAGLLSLREQQAFTLYGSRTTLDAIEAGLVFGVLGPAVKRHTIALGERIDMSFGLAVMAFPVPGKAPL